MLFSQCAIWLVFLSIKKVILQVTLRCAIWLKFLWIKKVIFSVERHQIIIIKILSLRIIGLLKVLQETFICTLRQKFFMLCIKLFIVVFALKAAHQMLHINIITRLCSIKIIYILVIV